MWLRPLPPLPPCSTRCDAPVLLDRPHEPICSPVIALIAAGRFSDLLIATASVTDPTLVLVDAPRNTSLLSPFLLDYPSSLSHTLDDSASCIAFNPSGYFAGSFIAVGRTDGCISIWDVLTHDVVWVENGHAKAVASVSWSRNSRFLLTASKDGTAIVWDLERGERVETVRFASAVVNAQFHPGNARVFVATLATGQAVIVDLRPSSRSQREVLDYGAVAADGDETMEDVGKGKGRAAPAAEEEHAPQLFTYARFNPSGRRLYVGTKKGELLVLDPHTVEVLDRVKISNSAVVELAFSHDGQYVVVNSHDRAVRVLSIAHSDAASASGADEGRIRPLHRFQDLVNRTPWEGVGCSNNGEYAVAGSGSKIAHDIYIWNLGDGSLTKMLEGPREPLIGVDWHPTKPMIASISGFGSVYLWEEKQTDTWSAFAPGFEELEENATYVEREDEFDEEDASEALRRKEQAEDARIDILSTSPPRSSVLLLPRPPSTAPVASTGTAEQRWWWEAEGDGDDKVDWYLPIKLGKNGRVWRDWDSLFE